MLWSLSNRKPSSPCSTKSSIIRKKRNSSGNTLTGCLPCLEASEKVKTGAQLNRSLMIWESSIPFYWIIRRILPSNANQAKPVRAANGRAPVIQRYARPFPKWIIPTCRKIGKHWEPAFFHAGHICRNALHELCRLDKHRSGKSPPPQRKIWTSSKTGTSGSKHTANWINWV